MIGRQGLVRATSLTGFALAGAAACLPSPALADSPPGPFLAFFDWDSVKIESAAAERLDNVVWLFGKIVGNHIVISAHADRSGSETYNLDLSRRRAKVVRGYLVRHGVPEAAISVRAYGETQPLVETEDGVREAQNRYVFVTYIVR